VDIEILIELFFLLVVANGTPVLLGILLKQRFAWPLDGGLRLLDGRALFGPSKTVRGIIGAVAASALVAPACGLERFEGALFGLLAMAGDLISSFIKRRLNYPPSCRFPLLDQLPETCLPLLLLQPATGASLPEIALAIMLFTGFDLLMSKLYHPDQAQCK